MNEDQPIEVRGTSLPSGIMAGMRIVLSTVLSYLVGAGYVNASHVEGIIAIAVIVATAAYGIYNTIRKQKQLIITADASPNFIAKVK